MPNDTTPTRVCSKCKREFPATLECFHADKRRKDGLDPRCKICVREYHQANKVKLTERAREYNRANQDKVREYQREYYLANQDKLVTKAREYALVNKDKRREYNRANRDKVRERERGYRQANSEKYRIKSSRRNARKRSLPDTFTVEQWLMCLEYFHYCCAVCGKQLRDLFQEVVPHADHWLPLNSPECLGTTVDNMICLCSSCNSSKQDKRPDVWLVEKYGKRKAAEILMRIQAYFEQVKLE